MAESMVGLKRSHRCTEVSSADIGKKVTVMGWVAKRRNLGSLIFVDLRDRSGILQILFDENIIGKEGFDKAYTLRNEFVIAVEGEVIKRSGAVNENLKTGDIEIAAKTLRILSESETPPFPIEENIQTKEDIRLKYRCLDLRRPDIQSNIIMRSKVATLTRAFLANEGFLEIETPMLTKSTPEGARDYLVPSRIHPGKFYALPQSPQLFKQMLMCSGYDRYMQIARCFRDEDLRADRQPEFTQIDMELSFVDVDDVIDVNERLLAYLFKEVLDVDVKLPIQRMTWQEAMDRFGSDKPDMRFGMELHDVSDVVKNCGFSVFTSALENGGSVRGINAEGQGAMPRKKIDKLVEFAKGYGAKGLAYIAIHEDGSWKSSFSKFMTEEQMEALIKAMDGQAGDLLLFAADRNKIVWNVLGALRLELAKQMECEKKQIVVGYRDAHTFLKEEFEQAGELYISTEDGSVGTKGNVMDAIRENALEADMIYACGPTPMLRAIKQYAETNGIECYISLEERMACGIGACLACVCKSKEKDAHSNVHNKRICKDGPVFLSTEVEI